MDVHAPEIFCALQNLPLKYMYVLLASLFQLKQMKIGEQNVTNDPCAKCVSHSWNCFFKQ